MPDKTVLTYADLTEEEKWDAVLCVDDGVLAKDCTYLPCMLTPAEIRGLYRHAPSKDAKIAALMENLTRGPLKNRPVIARSADGRVLVEGNHRLMAHYLLDKNCPCLEVRYGGSNDHV